VYLIHCNGTDGSTDFRDDNGDHTAGRTGLIVGANGNAQVDTAQSKYGGASALFDGTGDYLRSPTFPALGTGDFTIEYWTRFENLPSANGYMTFDARPGSNGAYPLIYHGNSTPGDIRYFVSGADRITTGAVISADTWHHLAVVRSSGTTKLYVDGTQQGSDYTDSTDYQASSKLTIGANMNDINSLDGHIDELRVSNSARYTTTFTAPTEPFVDDANTLLLLHMNGADGSTTFTDDVGGRSSVGVSAINNAQVDTAQSKYGGASLLLDGTDDIVAIGDDGDSNYILIPTTGEFTWEFYVRPVDTTFQLISSVYGAFGDANPAGRFWIGIFENKFTFSVNGGGTITDASTATTGSWVHLAAVRDSSNEFRFYVDGTEVGTSFTSSVTLASGYVAIGGTGNAYDLDYEGHVDEYRISDVCRYTANFTAPTEPFQNDANTLALLHMDGTDGSTTFIDDNGKQA
jgi:hypothetical protein